MKKRFRHLRVVITVIILAVTVGSGLLNLVPPHAHAAPVATPDGGAGSPPASSGSSSSGVTTFDQMPVDKQAVIWTELAALGACNRGGYGIDKTKLSTWYGGTVDVGMHVDPTDGKLSCDDENGWLTNLFNAAGWQGQYSAHWDVNPQNVQSEISKILFPSGRPSNPPDAVKYYILWKAFINTSGDTSCAAVPTPDTIDGKSHYSGGPAYIYIYDTSTQSYHISSYMYKNNTYSTTVGFWTHTGNPTDSNFECDTLASLLSQEQYAKAYAAAAANTNGPGVGNNPIDGTGNGPTDAPDPELQCGTEKSRMDWIVCPVIKLIDTTVTALDNAIITMLEVDKNVVDETSTDPNAGGPKYYAAWQQFRNIALGIVVIAALIMLISQAMGFDVFDAYTIKKVMPRLVIAIIGITLSWELMKWFVIFTNDLGLGVRELIFFPFRGFGDGIIIKGGANTIIEILSFGGIIALKIGGLGTLAGTALLALGLAFVVLVARQIVIALLIMTAPLAIACYVLPNTQSIWKIWHESFTKALLMFPIIMAFLATGRVFAQVSAGGGTVGQLMAFFAYIIPYFLIPLTFRFAGGAMRTIGGFANDKSRGAFDRLKKKRGAILSRNMRDLKNFNYGNERTALGRGINTALGAAANPTSLLRGRRGVNARRHALQTIAGQQNLKDNEIVQANSNDDNFLVALADKKLAQTKLDKAQANYNSATSQADRDKYAAEINARRKGLDAVNQLSMHTRNSRANRMAALDALTKTGYQFSRGYDGYQELDSVVRSIAGGDERARAQLMDSSQYNIRANGGRFDLGGINHGAGFDAETGLGKGSLYELANGKAESITEMGESAGAGPVGQRHAVVYQELKNMLPNAKGANRDKVIEEINKLEARGIQEFMATKAPPEQEVVQYNPALEAQRKKAAKKAGVPYAAWTPTEIAQGWRHQNVSRTYGEKAAKEARVYERPDPNRMA